MYTPPFTISSRTIHLIADISALVERYAIRMEQEDALLLRKINRIKTIQGSLAIEGNTLSESQITDILDGKHIVAPIREIQEDTKRHQNLQFISHFRSLLGRRLTDST